MWGQPPHPEFEYREYDRFKVIPINVNKITHLPTLG